MPDPQLHSCVEQVMEQGYDEQTAYAICNAALHNREVMDILKKHSDDRHRRSNMEVRHVRKVEFREAETDEATPQIVGYAAMFDQESEDLGGFRESLRPGAFGAALQQGRNIPALINHDPSTVFARTGNGSLSLEEDELGLRFEIDLLDDVDARRAYSKVSNGLMDSCSFAFRVAEGGDEWHDDGEGTIRRVITDIAELGDVSIVTDPAYTQTMVAARSARDILDEYLASQRALEAKRRGQRALARERLVRARRIISEVDVK